MASKSSKELAEQLALQLGFEAILQPVMQKELQKIAEDAATIYESSPEGSGLVAVSYQMSYLQMRFERVLKGFYPDVIKAFSSRNFRNLARVAKHERKAEATYEADFATLADQWMQEQGLEAADSIADTTRQDIIKIIVQGQQEGLGSAAIASLIRKTVGVEMSRYRAQTIAITETHNAASFANYESAKAINNDLDLGVKKKWLSTEDARTRPTHRAVNNQVRGIDETFTVGSAQMQRPGDPAGGGKNLVRCRCVLGWVTTEDED